MSVEVRVMVVDDQESFRCVAASVVAATEGFTPGGSADSGEAAVALVAGALLGTYDPS